MSVSGLVNGLSQLGLGSTSSDSAEEPSLCRFAVLEHAPPDHHYRNQVLGSTTPEWSAQVRREHSILSSSLPPRILVRAYEDRLDLVRCLILGPLGTPFANAPLLFDIRLPPASYPQSPPLVFFHSGSTRISPNLYETGMVCLSLLGTWQGAHACEMWQSGTSTILQLLVSIQGLILVKQPYFTEPGYEPSKGTAQGERLR
jgi:ubiquitin-conjugating enzyme E2 O